MKQKLFLLLVEDNQADRMFITNAICNSGYDVEIKYAENIEDGLVLTTVHNFDCILLDYYFQSQPNGFDFINRFKGRNGQTPIVMVTSYSEPSHVVESMKLGVSDYIAKKDISPETFAKSFTHALQLRQAEVNRAIAEKALLESELSLKTIIERSPVIVFNIDINGYIKLFRGKGIIQLALKPEQVIGRHISEVWQQTPIRLNDYYNALKHKEYTHNVMINNHHFEVTYLPVHNQQQQFISMMGVALDVTEHKRNEEQLLSTIEVTEAASKIKEQFLANMSHEIRTPIHGIISLTKFVLNTKLTSEQLNYLQLVQRSANSLLVIVNDILDLSKIEAGKMNIEEIDFDLRELINAVILTFSAQTEDKKIVLNLLIDDSTPDNLSGDPVRLTQILNNMVGNAVKFTEKGSVDIYIRKITGPEEKPIIEFKIKDTGIGIPANKLSLIFDSFTQAGSDTSRKYGGTGLGMAISKKLIEQQNGKVSVKSKVNEGTEFTFSIPFKTGASKKSTTLKTAQTMSETKFENIHILVAEDNDINRFIIDKMLREWKIKATYVQNGEEAVRQLSSQSFDLVLMDIEMPGTNGYQATELIRVEIGNTSIPIIAMTGHAMEAEKNKCFETGMSDYISKPFQAEELRDKIAKWAGQSPKQKNTDTDSLTSENMETAQLTNLDFLREISAGNESFFKEFITLFLTTAPASIKDMEVCLEAKDWETLRQVSHKIKPSFNYVGLKELSQAAARIEECAKNKSNLDELPALINKIKDNCNIAFRELEVEIQAGLTS